MNEFILNYGQNGFLMALAMAPSIILGIIIYKKDVVEKEPLPLLIKLLFYGVLSVGIALLFELKAEDVFRLKNDVLGIFIKSFIFTALSEEGVKWLFLYFSCWRDKNFDYTYDAIVYAAFIALGFATVENVAFVMNHNQNFMVAIERGLITVPAHAFFGILSGYYLGLAKKYEQRLWVNKSRKALISSFVFPLLIHGLFDFTLYISTKANPVLPILLIIYLYITSIIKVTN